MLYEKAQQNFDTAVWAEDQNYFCVATSRLYYSLYQKILYILKCVVLFAPQDKDAEDSHNDVIKTFFYNDKIKMGPEQRQRIHKIYNLKHLRKEADYCEKSYINKDDYEKRFKRDYREVDNVLEHIINRDIKKE